MNKHELSLNISLELQQWACMNDLDDKIPLLKLLPHQEDIRLAVLAAEVSKNTDDMYELMKKYHKTLNTPFEMTQDNFNNFIAVLVKNKIIPLLKK